MLELIDKINLDENLKQKVIDLAQKDRVNILYLSEKCNSGNFSCLKRKDDLTRLAVMIECSANTKKKYKQLGIDDKILYDTLDDIRIWCENNNNKGLKNYDWIKNHINAELFRIGRLQYQFYPCKNMTLNYNKLPFKYGENLIFIHIPQGEKLEYSKCVESLDKSVSFFKEFFPDYKYRYYLCESWLLYGENHRFMKSQSNILKFSSMFDIAYSIAYDEQAIERIFGKRQIIKANYPENTSLQKSAKEFMINSGRLGIGIGTIDKYKI
ncbi:MAG: acyltransferase domain-containing protein [Eubacterium sp.]